MTDRQPDDFYDALRDRLAPYGQEPPAPLWASIRAQLPPPVAAPRLRRRRPLVLLLGLLLAVVGAASWQGWRTGGAGQRAGRDAARATAGRPANSASATAQTRKGHRPPTSRTRPAPPLLLAAQPAATVPSATPTPTNANGATRAASASVGPGVATTRVTSGYGSTRTHPATHPALAAAATATAMAVETGAAQSAVSSAAASSAASRERKAVALLASPDVAGRPFSAAHQTKTPLAERPAAGAAARPDAARAGTYTAKTAPSAIFDARPTASRRAYSPGSAAEAAPAAGATPSASIASSAQDQPTLTSTEEAALVGQLAARVVAPRLLTAAAPVAAPTVRAWADTVPPRPRPVVRRWAVLVLAGPALTHRQLGAAAGSAPASGSGFPITPLPGPTTTYSPPKELARQERPGVGFGAQVLLRRALSGRWSLSTGLGYQEYATQASTVASTPAANQLPPTPAPEYAHRDTYRFLTVPIRLGYALGPANGRLHAGLLAGADATLYLGGRTLAADGSLSTWNRGNSPNSYRALGVALSAGLEVRYRLAPRLSLVAQPTATYFLTSLPAPMPDRDSRYLWGVGGLLGVSFDVF